MLPFRTVMRVGNAMRANNFQNPLAIGFGRGLTFIRQNQKTGRVYNAYPHCGQRVTNDES